MVLALIVRCGTFYGDGAFKSVGISRCSMETVELTDKVVFMSQRLHLVNPTLCF